MNVHPDDNPLAAALREELQAKRGGAYFEMGRIEPWSGAAPDPRLAEEGFKAAPEWTLLSPAEAIECVAALLAREPSLDVPAMLQAEAEAFAVRFRSLVSGNALFYAFDSGVLFVDGDRMGRVWVEAED